MKGHVNHAKGVPTDRMARHLEHQILRPARGQRLDTGKQCTGDAAKATALRQATGATETAAYSSATGDSATEKAAYSSVKGYRCRREDRLEH
eukprot:scaffold127785_cov23-Tisochrysis_lutea.AAC.1